MEKRGPEGQTSPPEEKRLIWGRPGVRVPRGNVGEIANAVYVIGMNHWALQKVGRGETN